VRITDIRAIPIGVPLAFDFVSALGTLKLSEYGLVVVETDEGVHGLGEISLIWHGNGPPLCRLVEDRLAPALRGADPFAITRMHEIVRELVPFSRHALTAVAALDMALLDLQGKVLGQPAYNLLGGLARDRVELSMSLSVGAADEVLKQARRLVDQGFGTLKVKAASAADLEVTHLLRREFGPELKIRVDLNMACSSAKEALRLIRGIAAADVLSVEQPLRPGDLDGMRYLRERSEVPIMADESVWGPDDAWELLHRGAADILNVYVSESGGPTRARQTIDLCAFAGVGVAIGSMPELGLGTSAAAHVAFSASRLDHPSDVAGHLYHSDDVVVHGLRVEGGALLPPPGPGLGVVLDEEKLARYRLDGRAVAQAGH
jgi:L-alanine-DL-glutamate epimerase-like enolase superfamily enzyme